MKHSLPHDAFVTRDQYEAALAASKRAEWDGEGLPPVGCECEVKRAMDWMKCKILFISEHHVVLKSKEEICWQTQSCQFRPIRTEAERKREKSLQCLMVTIDGFMTTEDRDLAEKIYDAIAAGKIPGVKLAD